MLHPASEAPPRLLALDNSEAFDTVEVDDVEACRRALHYTPSEFAEQLGWSLRKYQRVLEAAREDGFMERDVALAVRGLVDVLLGTDDDDPAITIAGFGAPLRSSPENKAVFGSRKFPEVLARIAENSGEWTAQVTPHLLRLVAGRAARGKTITYGEAATTLEEAKLTKRVWPRTLYGMPLGAICVAMMQLGREAGIRVPLLSVIVVKGSGMPGSGVDVMIKDFIKQQEDPVHRKDLLARLKRDREGLIGELQQEVFAFPHWSGVLWALGLETAR